MLLKNGHLIDPTTKTNEFMDIRIENGIITKIAKDLKIGRASCRERV